MRRAQNANAGVACPGVAVPERIDESQNSTPETASNATAAFFERYADRIKIDAAAARTAVLAVAAGQAAVLIGIAAGRTASQLAAWWGGAS